MRAFFGPPRGGPVSGGAQVAVYLVPVLEGRLLVFDVRAEHVVGRWLPWAVIDYRQNPYEAASILADDWLQEPLRDLTVVDVLSFDTPGGAWELAVVFRAELTAEPRPSRERVPYLFALGDVDAIGPFDPVDLERWIAFSPQLTAGDAADEPLLAEAPTPPLPAAPIVF